MKKIFLPLSLLAALTFTFSSCSKDDTEAPVITILGADPYNLEMLQSYVEFGATAEDNEDGDLTNSIVIDASEVDNRLPGSYEVHYEVADAAGNATDDHRQVIVYATANALSRTYNVLDTSFVGSASAPYAYTQTCIAVNSTTIKFSKFGDYSGATNITATINQDGTIVLPTQTALNIGSNSEDFTFSGTGYVTANGFYLDYLSQNLTASANATVHAYFSR